MRERVGRVRGLLGLVTAGLLFGAPALAVADITYIYDELGRLRAVVDPSQTDGTAIYTYDAVGNILSITRQPSSQVAIIEFNPKSGPVGTTVTLQGNGFSATPSQNAVTFNGTAATVTSATANQLVVTVPSGATTGPIGVTASGGSATSASSFTVTEDPRPTIAGFTPTLGVPGTTVTITGTNFQTNPMESNRVSFNGIGAPVSNATAMAIVANVPSLGASGRIAVSTPYGRAVSTGDFFALDPAFSQANVEVMERMAIGESKTVTISGYLKIALIIFDGSANQRVSVRVDSATIASHDLNVYAPDGTKIVIDPNDGGTFVDTFILPFTGTYTILVRSACTGCGGAITLTLYNVVDVTGDITVDGPPLTATTSTPGQNVFLKFNGTAGQGVGVAITSAISDRTVSILTPFGTVLASTGPGTANFLDTVTLPISGTYALLADPRGADTGAITLTLRGQPADLTGAITPGGPPVTVVIDLPLKNARLAFSGTAGQRISIAPSAITIPFSKLSITRNSDSSQVLAPTGVSNAGNSFIDPVTLPTAGAYTLLVDPVWTDTGSMTLTMYGVPADVTGTLKLGTPKSVTLGTPGQNARFTFSGTAGRKVSLLATNPTFSGVVFSIVKPSGFDVLTGIFYPPDTFTRAWTLTDSGTYTVVVDPYLNATGSATFTVYDVVDVTGSLTINGPSKTATVTTPGQTVRYSFSGNAGQSVTARLTGNTLGCADVWLQDPPGSQTLAFGTMCGSALNLSATLPAAGTWQVTISPQTPNTGSVTVQVTSP